MPIFAGPGNDWTQDETILAYELLLVHGQGAPKAEVDLLAALLGRSEGSVRRKLGNLRSAETHGAEGLPHRSQIDGETVAQFKGDLAAVKTAAQAIRAGL